MAGVEDFHGALALEPTDGANLALECQEMLRVRERLVDQDLHRGFFVVELGRPASQTRPMPPAPSNCTIFNEPPT